MEHKTEDAPAVPTEANHPTYKRKRLLSPYVLVASLAVLVFGYILGPWIMVRVLYITERARVEKLMDVEVSDINEEATGRTEPDLELDANDS